MKKLLGLALSVAFFSHTQAAVQEIDISGMAFSPNVIDINQGDTIRWINRDTMTHTVQGEFASSETLNQDGRFEFVFNEAGNFDYICSIHPSMTGTIRVAAVTELIAEEDEGAVNFSDLFGTGESFEPDNLATVSQPFESEPAPQLETVSVTPEPPATVEVAPPLAPPTTSTFNTSAPAQSVAYGSTQNLPTAGGNNWYVYLGVLLFLGGFFYLSGSSRR